MPDRDLMLADEASRWESTLPRWTWVGMAAQTSTEGGTAGLFPSPMALGPGRDRCRGEAETQSEWKVSLLSCFQVFCGCGENPGPVCT